MKFIARVIEDIRNNTMDKFSSFAQIYFMHKVIQKFGRKGNNALTKEMERLYRQNCFEPIYIK